MDAFLLSLMLCLLVESASETPRLAWALRQRYNHSLGVTLGVMLGLGANAAVAAVAGKMIAGLLTSEARDLFFAFALGAAGLGLMFRARRVDRLEGWKLGAFLTSALGLFILGFGESASFLIAGIAAARADPWMAAVGGGAGTMIACLVLPHIVETQTRLSMTWVKASRIGAAIMLMLAAFFVAMGALRLL